MSRVLAFASAALLLSAGVATFRTAAQDEPAVAQQAAPSCDKSMLVNFEISSRDGQPLREAPVWQTSDGSAFFFQAGMTIDADGAPNAYNPDNTGLDDLANAGEPGHWQGIVQDEMGEPFVQGLDDPFPGYYVSCTSLVDRSRRPNDPRRYVDASKVPYVVLPGGLARAGGMHLGDLALVTNQRNGASSYAIFADVGTFGEGSIALADNLGIHSDARIGGTRGGILYVLFPHSGDGTPHTADEISGLAGKHVESWGGPARLDACLRN